jgi:ligand-binding sensor domain-containing protein
VGYSNGNIDLIANNEVINLPDIKRSIIQGFKSINEIFIKEDFAFLSTGFGIVKLDIQRQEIKETYFIGDNGTNIFVNDLTFFIGKIYAVTNNGIYSANQNSSNLANFQNWEKLNIYSNSVLNQIESNDSVLLLNISTSQYNGDTIVSYNGSKWEKLSYDNYTNNDIENINYQDEKWLFSFTYNGIILNKKFEKEGKIYAYRFDSPMSIEPRKIIKIKNGDFWIADKEHGLVKRESEQSFDILAPTGPAHYSSWNLDFEGDALWVASGGLTPSINNQYQKKGVYKYQNNSWSSYNGGAYDSLFDLISVNINPQNTNEVYFGSWGKGLIKTNNGQVKEVYNKYNSGIQSLNLFVDHQIGGSVFDENNVLWVTCSGSGSANVNNPLVAFDGQQWHAFNMNNMLVNSSHTGEIFIAENGYKWFLSKNNGVFVFDNNETLENKEDDRIALITTGESTGNLPTKMVHCIAEDNDGQIWIGTEEGLTVINSTLGIFDGEVKANRITIEQDDAFQYLLETEVIKTIKVDGGNRKWIGTASGGAYLVSKDGQKTIHHFTAENSALLSNTIFDIEIFGTTGEVFFATDKGLVSYVGDATDPNAYDGPTYAYPNPVRPEYQGLIGIKGLVENSEVKITDITGNVIYETMSEGTTATWNGKSLNGKKAQTGVYIVFSVGDDGLQKEVTKILFIN